MDAELRLADIEQKVIEVSEGTDDPPVAIADVPQVPANDPFGERFEEEEVVVVDPFVAIQLGPLPTPIHTLQAAVAAESTEDARPITSVETESVSIHGQSVATEIYASSEQITEDVHLDRGSEQADSGPPVLDSLVEANEREAQDVSDEYPQPQDVLPHSPFNSVELGPANSGISDDADLIENGASEFSTEVPRLDGQLDVVPDQAVEEHIPHSDSADPAIIEHDSAASLPDTKDSSRSGRRSEYKRLFANLRRQ